MTRWSESSEDIRALEEDGQGWAAGGRPWEALHCWRRRLSVASVKNDDAGNVRLQKRGSNNTSLAMTWRPPSALGSGAHQRRSKAPTAWRCVPWKIGLTYRRADLCSAQWRRLRRHILARDSAGSARTCGKLLGRGRGRPYVCSVMKGGKSFDPSESSSPMCGYPATYFQDSPR